MKTEIYNKATENIHKIVMESVMLQIPTLDYIMGVENMSENDKIWYNAYKKYGNRGHTWTDFRDMFHGDIETMQKTVAYWKTWDQLNFLLHRADILQKNMENLLLKYDIKYITMANIGQLRKTHPDLIEAHERYLLVKSQAIPNYSVYNPEYAKLQREFESKMMKLRQTNEKSKFNFILKYFTKKTDPDQVKKNLVIEYIQKMDEYIDLKNGDFVVGERIEIYREIILNNRNILKMAMNFKNLTGVEKIDLARLILNKSSEIMGTPRGTVVNDEEPDGTNILTKSQIAGYQRTKKRFLFKENTEHFSDLWMFLKTLAHEDAHRIDDYNPEYGMIGTQMMIFSNENYMNTSEISDEIYQKWATEQSSYYIGKTTGVALESMIKRRQRS